MAAAVAVGGGGVVGEREAASGTTIPPAVDPKLQRRLHRALQRIRDEALVRVEEMEVEDGEGGEEREDAMRLASMDVVHVCTLMARHCAPKEIQAVLDQIETDTVPLKRLAAKQTAVVAAVARILRIISSSTSPSVSSVTASATASTTGGGMGVRRRHGRSPPPVGVRRTSSMGVVMEADDDSDNDNADDDGNGDGGGSDATGVGEADQMNAAEDGKRPLLPAVLTSAAVPQKLSEILQQFSVNTLRTVDPHLLAMLLHLVTDSVDEASLSIAYSTGGADTGSGRTTPTSTATAAAAAAAAAASSPTVGMSAKAPGAAAALSAVSKTARAKAESALSTGKATAAQHELGTALQQEAVRLRAARDQLWRTVYHSAHRLDALDTEVQQAGAEVMEARRALATDLMQRVQDLGGTVGPECASYLQAGSLEEALQSMRNTVTAQKDKVRNLEQELGRVRNTVAENISRASEMDDLRTGVERFSKKIAASTSELTALQQQCFDAQQKIAHKHAVMDQERRHMAQHRQEFHGRLSALSAQKIHQSTSSRREVVNTALQEAMQRAVRLERDANSLLQTHQAQTNQDDRIQTVVANASFEARRTLRTYHNARKLQLQDALQEIDHELQNNLFRHHREHERLSLERERLAREYFAKLKFDSECMAGRFQRVYQEALFSLRNAHTGLSSSKLGADGGAGAGGAGGFGGGKPNSGDGDGKRGLVLLQTAVDTELSKQFALEASAAMRGGSKDEYTRSIMQNIAQESFDKQLQREAQDSRVSTTATHEHVQTLLEAVRKRYITSAVSAAKVDIDTLQLKKQLQEELRRADELKASVIAGENKAAAAAAGGDSAVLEGDAAEDSDPDADGGSDE